jgi:hypothetical protein
MQINTIKQNHNAEIALIILCCRCYIQTANSSSIPLFIQDNKIDWKQFYQLSTAHRIRPVVYKTLDPFKEFIHPENLIELRNYCFFFNAFALNNKRELTRILNTLKQNNISAKAFKGIDFSENIYGNIGMREFSDNDIIILEPDIDRLISVMVNEGYYSKDVEFYKKYPSQYTRDYKDLLFEKGNGITRDFAFEFHFKTSRYYQGYNFSFAQVLGEDFISEFKKYDADQYLKLITISNGLMDYYPNLRSILDLAIILKKLDCSYIYHVDPVLNDFIDYGRMVSVELLNYPEDSAELNAKNTRTKFSSYLQKNILGLKEGKRIPLLRYMYFRIKNADTIKDKIVELKNYILLFVRPNEDDLMTIKLPNYYLYYFTKPIRILIKLFQGRFK